VADPVFSPAGSSCFAASRSAAASCTAGRPGATGGNPVRLGRAYRAGRILPGWYRWLAVVGRNYPDTFV